MKYKRFMVDDAGTLIDTENLICYDIVEELVDLLNIQDETIIEQAIQLDYLKCENKHMCEVLEENKQLKRILKELV